MCGICGVFALNGPLDPEVRAALPAMNGALAHRGPDGDGFFDDARVALGHRRLAIIDRAGGHQPMANEDGTCWIVFNGEIYNHRALRPLLEAKGHRFRTVVRHRSRSCTPTRSSARRASIASKACSRSRSTTGAGRSSSRRAIASARSRSSTPCSTARFHFASELPALAHSPRWRGDVDLTALEGYLSLGYFLAPVDDLPRRLQAAARTLAARRRRPGRDAPVLGRPGVRHRRSARRRADRRDRRDAAPGRARAARKRSAARRVSERRHRLRPRRVVHGRGARRSAGDGVGRLRRRRAQRARGGGRRRRATSTAGTTRESSSRSSTR